MTWSIPKTESSTFTVDTLFNKLNDRVVTFGNNVSEHRRVSTTKHPASIMMFVFVASNREKMHQVWFIVNKYWRWNSFQDSVNQITSSNRTKRQNVLVTVQNRLNVYMSFWTKQFLAPIFTRLEHPWLQLVGHIEENDCKTRRSNTDELKASVNFA